MKKTETSRRPGGLDVVLLRYGFYREGLGAAIAIIIVLSIALTVSVAMSFYFASKPVVREYFSVDSKGSIVPLVPMNVPYVTESALLDFASKAVREAYTFDAENYRDVMMGIQQYFTPDGHKEFLVSMQPQIKYVLDNILIASAVPSGTPVLSDSGVSNGVYAFRIRVPVVVTFRTQTDSSTVKRLVTLVVVRRPTYETPYGVGISSFKADDIN